MTPCQRGWRLPPAWAMPGRFWLAWPRAGESPEAHDAALELAALLSDFAPVTMLANAEDVCEAALKTPAGVNTLAVPHATLHLRAVAPAFLVDGQGRLVAGLDAGGSAAAAAVLDWLGVPALAPPAGLDTATLDVDGEGTALAADDLPGRLGLDTAETERLLATWFGIERVVWVPLGEATRLAEVVRFLGPAVVATSGAGAALADFRDARGRRFAVTVLPRPRRQHASFADCLVAGNLVVVPAYEDSRDLEAFESVAAALPGRKVVSHLVGGLATASGGLGAAVAVQPPAGFA